MVCGNNGWQDMSTYPSVYCRYPGEPVHRISANTSWAPQLSCVALQHNLCYHRYLRIVTNYTTIPTITLYRCLGLSSSRSFTSDSHHRTASDLIHHICSFDSASLPSPGGRFFCHTQPPRLDTKRRVVTNGVANRHVTA